MVFGGALSLSDRRLRVGAPQAGQGEGCDAAGGVDGMRWLRLLALLLRCAARGQRSPCSRMKFFADPALEARARELSRELRCMVCQNQSIDDSDAPLARDLRILVRERLKAGDSNRQVLDFLVARYGEFVLLRPRSRLAHGAAVAGAAGPAPHDRAGMLVMMARRRKAPLPYRCREAGGRQPHGRRGNAPGEASQVRGLVRLGPWSSRRRAASSNPRPPSSAQPPPRNLQRNRRRSSSPRC